MTTVGAIIAYMLIPKRGKKISKTKLKNKADILFSLYIRNRDKMCVRCHRTAPYQLHCAHIITRANLRLRFDPMNAYCLCSLCHRWWHDSPTESGKWFEETFPINYDYLLKNKNKIEKPDYQEVVGSLKKLLESDYVTDKP